MIIKKLFSIEKDDLTLILNPANHNAKAGWKSTFPFPLLNENTPLPGGVFYYIPKSSNDIFSFGTPRSLSIFTTALFITGGPQK